MTFKCMFPGCSVEAKTESGLKRHALSAHEERASDEVLIDGRKRVKTVQDEFTALYPYLGLHFFTEEEMKRSRDGATVRPLSGEKTLASVRAHVGDNAALRFTGRMYVGTLEKAFSESFGLLAQVCTQKNGASFYTSGEQDAVSLNELNRLLGDRGYSRFDYASWRK